MKLRVLQIIVFTLAVTAGIPALFAQAESLPNANYKVRWKEALKFFQTNPVNWDDCEMATKALIKDFPDKPNGYCDMMMLIEHYEAADGNRAIELADELTAESVPERFRLWGKGCLNRLNGFDKPVSIQFTAIDGRGVDTTKMKGKVVLIDFWATTCSPCVAELKKIKELRDEHGARGFEVIGISCDNQQQIDQKGLERFLKRKEINWPQFYDGKNATENKWGQAFGIDGIPHVMLMDRRGNLRFDRVSPNDLEKKILELLSVEAP